jgi:hypothetical protein
LTIGKFQFNHGFNPDSSISLSQHPRSKAHWSILDEPAAQRGRDHSYKLELGHRRDNISDFQSLESYHGICKDKDHSARHATAWTKKHPEYATSHVVGELRTTISI